MLTAQWEIVADHARRALLWQPIVPLEEASHGLDLELADKGWALIYLKIDPFLEFVLPGQLFKTRVIKREDEPIAEVRVKVRDLSDAWTTPVALAWPPPDQEANQEATRLRATDFLPPSTLGLLGVVFVNTQRVIYPLECLDAQAHALQAELSALLLRITMQDYIKESGRFQQAQVCAHLLASRFYAYHVLHSAQESNDTVSPLASPTHESPVLLPSLTPVEPEQLPRPALLSISPQRTFLIPAAQPVKAVLEAIYAAQEDLWREQAGIPTYEVVKHAGKTIVQIRAEAAGAEPDEQMIHFLRQIVHALSDVDAVVFLALLGIHMASAPDEHGGHWVYVEDLAELRALRPKIHRAEGGKNARQALIERIWIDFQMPLTASIWSGSSTSDVVSTRPQSTS